MAKKGKIDLSKIAVKDTAREKIEADFDGTGPKEYEIRALYDDERQCVGFLSSDNLDVTKARNFYVLLLAYGLTEINEDQSTARFLLRNCNGEAVKVANAIFALTQRFYESKEQELEEAEKNSEEKAPEESKE